MLDVVAGAIVGSMLVVDSVVLGPRVVVVVELVGALVEGVELVVVTPGSGVTVMNFVFSFTQNVLVSFTNVALFYIYDEIIIFFLKFHIN